MLKKMRKKKKIQMPLLRETKCPICGNLFLPAPQHVYRDRRSPYSYVCSWKCVCISERLREEARAKNEG